MKREQLEVRIIEWAENKELNDPVKQTLKTLSEAGELADAVCKMDFTFYPSENGHTEQRNTTKQLEDLYDAIGDVEFCLTVLKHQLGLVQDYPLNMVCKDVLNRKGKTVNGTFIKD